MADESDRSEQQSFLDFAKGRCVRATKAGREDEAEIWYEAAEAITQGHWLHHRVINSDPGVMKFQNLRANMAYNGRIIQG